MKKSTAALIFAILAAASLGCRTYDRDVLRRALIDQNMNTARELLAKGHRQEAAQIFRLIASLEGREHAAASYSDAIDLTSEQVVGFNFGTDYLCGHRINRFGDSERKRAWIVALCYPLNRLLDLSDIVSIHIGSGGGLFVDVHATRAMQAQLGGASSVGIDVLTEKRNLLLSAEKWAGIAVGPFESSTVDVTYVGLMGGGERQYSVPWLSSPFLFAHQFYRDYWEVGFRTVVPGVDIGAGVHLSEAFDAIFSFFGFDILNDSIIDRRRLRLSGQQKRAIVNLIGTYSAGELKGRLKYRSPKTIAQRPAAASASESAAQRPPRK